MHPREAMRALLLLLLAQCARWAECLELTTEDWHEKTSGKTVFIKFMVAWCGHCQALKPDWAKLMKTYEGHSSVVVAQVNCEGGGEGLCHDFGIESYPTIKHGDPGDASGLQDYDDEIDFTSLDQFVRETLAAKCSPENPELCDDKEQVMLKKFQGMDMEDLQNKVKENDDILVSAEKEFDAWRKKYEDEYTERLMKKNQAREKIISTGHRLMKSVHDFRKRQTEL